MITEIPVALRICDNCGEVASGACCESCAEIVHAATSTARLCAEMGLKTVSLIVDKAPTKAQVYYRLVFAAQFRAYRLGQISEGMPRVNKVKESRMSKFLWGSGAICLLAYIEWQFLPYILACLEHWARMAGVR